MKKITTVLVIVLVSIVFLGVAEKNNWFNLKHLGHEEYFVQITEDGERILLEQEVKNGEKVSEDFYRYYYETVAYNKEGKEIKVRFDANKNLKIGAFLSIETISQSEKKINSIADYKEVQENQLPQIVKEKLLGK
ncbi:YxeA family protein [Lutibacter sp. B2]|nr:YxeA family protein [Lutibacter sp. B2]